MRLEPEYPICTERLRLRPLTEKDTDALVGYRSLPDVCRYVPFEPMDRQVVLDRIGSMWSTTAIRAEGDALTLGIELSKTGELIGDAILFFHSELHQYGEIGWLLHPARQGQGYATEAASALLKLAFDDLGLRRVVARVDARNRPSQNVCVRLGMRREAHLLQNEWFKGEWTDEIDYALLAAEWRGQSRSCDAAS